MIFWLRVTEQKLNHSFEVPENLDHRELEAPKIIRQFRDVSKENPCCHSQSAMSARSRRT